MPITPALIYSIEDFQKIPMRDSIFSDALHIIGMTSGGFDPLHPGHASCIMESANHCNLLIVAVNGDNFLTKKKGRPFMDVKTRCQIVSHLAGVDLVVSFDGYDEEDMTAIQPLEIIKPHIFFKGGDRKDMSTIPEWETCQKHNIIVKPGMGEEKFWSSSDFLKDWLRTSNGSGRS